jgi:hypothetical protein
MVPQLWIIWTSSNYDYIIDIGPEKERRRKSLLRNSEEVAKNKKKKAIQRSFEKELSWKK